MLVEKNKQAIFLASDCVCPFTATPKEIFKVYKTLNIVIIKAIDCYGKIHYLEFKFSEVNFDSFN